MTSGRALAAIAGACVLVAAGLGGCGSAAPKPELTLGSYLQAWHARNYPAMAALVDHPPGDFAAVHRQVLADLKATSATYQAGVVTQHGSSASAPVTATVAVPGYGNLVLRTTLALHLSGSQWKVAWQPSTVVPGLVVGDHLALQAGTVWPARAPILGENGVVLTPSTQTVTVGLIGSRLKDAAHVAATLIASGFVPATVNQAVAAAQADPGAFQTIATISQDRFAEVASAIYPLPGTSFTAQRSFSTLTPDLAAHIVGHVGPITAQELAQLGAPYGPTSMVGQGGLEAAYERQLAGSPAASVDLDNPAGTTVATVGSHPPVLGRAVVTGIDPTVEQAAEAAMNHTSQTSAMVVLRASTGQILASVSRPTDSGFELDLTGELPPGSTFKVITTDAILASGVSPDATLHCPALISAGGRTFHNDAGEALPSTSFVQAFAQSCNNAFIGATQTLPGSALPDAARRFGVGVTPQIGLPAYGGSISVPADAAEQAADSIGQGTVSVSPLVMATVAATADTGVLREPRLVVGAADDNAPATPVTPSIIATLHTFMAAVVTGSGTAAASGLPAGTYGKTGTAEYGTGTNPPTHAWFIGFRGDIAFAVFVDNGGGGAAAAPLAAALLNALPLAPP